MLPYALRPARSVASSLGVAGESKYTFIISAANLNVDFQELSNARDLLGAGMVVTGGSVSPLSSVQVVYTRR